MSDKYANATLMWIYFFRTLLFQLQDSDNISYFTYKILYHVLYYCKCYKIL